MLVDFLSWVSMVGVDEILKLRFFNLYFGMVEFLVVLVKLVLVLILYKVLLYLLFMVLRFLIVWVLEFLLIVIVNLVLLY